MFKAELNNFLTRELAEDGYSGVEVRVTPTRTEIIILATRTQNVLGEKGRRIRELTSVVQKRFGFPEGTVEVHTVDAIMCFKSSIFICYVRRKTCLRMLKESVLVEVCLQKQRATTVYNAQKQPDCHILQRRVVSLFRITHGNFAVHSSNVFLFTRLPVWAVGFCALSNYLLFHLQDQRQYWYYSQSPNCSHIIQN